METCSKGRPGDLSREQEKNIKRRKIIIGVAHECRDELKWLRRKVGQHDVRSAALEVPDDFSRREALGIGNFFSSLSDSLMESGVRIIPLETAESWDFTHVLFGVKAVVKGKISRKDMQECLMEFQVREAEYMGPAPELNRLAKKYRHFISIYEEMLAVLDNKDCASLFVNDFIVKRCAYLNRDRRMLSRINENEPDAVIVGDAHAQRLRFELRGFDYLMSPFVDYGRYDAY